MDPSKGLLSKSEIEIQQLIKRLFNFFFKKIVGELHSYFTFLF